jgi:DnaJ-class molecular chaperone
MTRSLNYYDILKISHLSTQHDIKSAYYKLSKQYHPDKNKSMEAKIMFQKVSDAYETLSNYNKRIKYDRELNIRNYSIKSTDYKKQDLAKYSTSNQFCDYNYQSIQKDIGYRFDEWTRLNYKKAFLIRRARLRAQTYQNKVNKERNTEIPEIQFSVIISILMIVAYIYLEIVNKNYDVDLVKKSRKSN